MRTIEQFQIRKIYAIGNALGIKAAGSEDELHALVGGVTGKDSIKSLTYKEACAVIKRLEELQGKTVSPKSRSQKPKEHKSRPGGVTSGQQKKVWFAMYLLPAAGTLYFALAGIWGLPCGEQVVGTITAVDTFLGVILGISTSQYNKATDATKK